MIFNKEASFFFYWLLNFNKREKATYKVQEKENKKIRVQEHCTTLQPNYITTPTQGLNLSIPWLRASAMKLADLLMEKLDKTKRR